MYTVNFIVNPYDMTKSYAQNAKRDCKFKSFKTLEEASAFATTVNSQHIIDSRLGTKRILYKSIKEIDVIRDLIKDLGLVESITTEGHVSMSFFTKDFSYPCTYIFNKD
jgi:hypothetical protein